MSEGAQVNGPSSPTGKFIDSIDPEDPEYIRNLQRPAEVKEDMKQMEGRSRVSVVLNSQAFKEELEAVIHEQIRQGGSASLFALQQISDLLLPQARGASSFSRSSPVIPVNDIRGVETLGYSKQEKVLRCKLAACYRLVDLYGWTHGIYNHISVRLSQELEQFLVNPFGMLYSEVTASTLVKVNVRGEVLDTGSTGLGISKAAFTLHSAVHQARPDIRCIIHLHTPAAVAVSATKAGFLPISQEALICGKVSYHEYRGILIDQDERDQLARNLGPFNKVMFLRNHGVVACGETIEEAFHYAFNLMAACEVQVKTMSVGLDNLVLVDEETRENTFKVGSQGGGGTDTSGRKWRCGELEWEAMMRSLDNSGYRTGHVYKQPLMKQEKKDRANSDVEVPPSSSSFTYIFDGDYEHSKYVSPLKSALERQKQAYKTGWLTSPNTYKKQEIEEIGTTTPKKITKWVQDGETAEQRSTAIRVESPNVFAPQGSNPKEFKEKQKSIRKDYYEEKVSAGPQSKILEGISWDEAARAKEGADQTVIVGAASKGIIQRDHQHNAVVYRSYYAANPFENMTEEEVNNYKQQVDQQEHGEDAEDVPGPDGQLISSEERLQQLQQSQEDMQPDTEANSAQETNNEPKENDQRQSQSEATSQPATPQESSTVSRPADPHSLAPKLEELGLDRLVDTLVQAVMASALPPASLSKGRHSPQGDGRAVGSLFDCPSDSFPFVSSDPPPSPQPPPANPSCVPSTLVPDSTDQGDVKTAVKANAMQISVPMEGTASPEAPEMMTVQLEPLKLFQGKPGDGVMKISFTIQSKVTRRKTKGPKASWPVENVTIMQSQPKITMVQSEKEEPPVKKILTEQQNIISTSPAEETPADKVPMSPTYQQKPAKRSHSLGRRQGAAAKLAKPKRKIPRWSRRGLTHPLSPVKEEFLEEDTLEALLARQKVELDSDESLEDLLLMTDNFKENLAPSHHHEVSSEPVAGDKPAPIATLEDLDESGHFSPSSAGHQEEPEEEFFDTTETPVFMVPKVSVNYPSSKRSGQDAQKRATPPPPPVQTEVAGTVERPSKLGFEVENEIKLINSEDDLQFADEELSSTVLEASDGDILPRKLDDCSLSAQQLDSVLETAKSVTDDMKETPETDSGRKLHAVDDGNKLQESDKQQSEDYSKSMSQSESEPESGFENEATDVVTETVQSIVDSVFEENIEPAVPVAPVTSAPLPQQENETDPSGPAIMAPAEEEIRPPTYRRDSATLETSPIVSSPPLDSFPPEPVYRELHRVRSLGDELDEPTTVQRRLKKGHSVVRRVQSCGPSADDASNRNRNVAVIDAVLHTVTIDPAKIAESGKPMATYLTESLDRSSQSDDKKKRWTLMDSVSKSLEDLDVKDLAKDGSLIYGRSLEVLIHDAVLPEESASTPSQTTSSPAASFPSMEDVLDKADKLDQKGTKLYKDDVVVITKAPMDFSAISPQVKKELAEEEGPLVTSSPKLGRRKEGSFKKYQSRMGKSEETLLEVTPVSPEKAHPTARRSKSFPKNYGLMKNRSKDTLLDDQPLLVQSDREEEMKGSSQSMPVLDEDTKRSNQRDRPRQTRMSDPFSSSVRKNDYPLQADDLEFLRRERGGSRLAYDEEAMPPAKINDSLKKQERRSDKEESRRRQGKELSPEPDSEKYNRPRESPEREVDQRRRQREQQSPEPDREQPRRRRGDRSSERGREQRRRRRERQSPVVEWEQDGKQQEESYERETEKPRRRKGQLAKQDQDISRKHREESPEWDREHPGRQRKKSSDRDRERSKRWREEESPESDREDWPRRGRRDSSEHGKSRRESPETGREPPRKERTERKESPETEREKPEKQRARSKETDSDEWRTRREESPMADSKRRRDRNSRRRRSDQSEERSDPQMSQSPDAADPDFRRRQRDSGRERRKRHQRNSEDSLRSPNTEAKDEDIPVETQKTADSVEKQRSESSGVHKDVAASDMLNQSDNSTGNNEFPPPPSAEELSPTEKPALTEAGSDADNATGKQQQQAWSPQEDTRGFNYAGDDEDVENGPPRVRRPRKKENPSDEDNNHPASDSVDDSAMRDKNMKVESVSPSEEPLVMSSFQQPVRSSQTLGEDFPSLSAKQESEPAMLTPADNHSVHSDAEKPQDRDTPSHIEHEGTVPIAGNLDILDYGDEPPRVRRSDRQQENKTGSRAKQRAEGRRKGRLGSDQETDTLSRGSEARLREHSSQDSLVSRESKSRDSRLTTVGKENRTSRDSLDERRKRVSRDNLDSKDTRTSRDSLASRGKSSLKEGRITDLDIQNFEDEPPRARRDKTQSDSMSIASRDKEGGKENLERPRSDGRVKGRQGGHGEERQDSDRPRRRGRRLEDSYTDTAPAIRVQAASRESLDKENFAPPLPPKQHRSMERLSEFSLEPRRSREFTDGSARNLLDVPPDLPPKKNKKKTLSCVSGGDMEMADKVKNEKKDKKSKDRSSSKDRKKMPAPPAPPASEDSYKEESRRRRAYPEASRLHVAEDDSYRRDSSFESSFERERSPPSPGQRRGRGGSSPYYHDSDNDEFDEPGDQSKNTGKHSSVHGDITPRPARKISTSSYGSASRLGRSVSFEDGYTPTMSHPPNRQKSRESLVSESSLHSTGYRVRSYSGASETSIGSNPLTHEPWRAKAAATQRHQARSPNTRRRRTRSQGEATYSAHSARRRHPNTGDANRLYQPRSSRSRASLPDAPSRSAAPSHQSKSRDTSMLADDSFSDANSHGYASESMQATSVDRSESDRPQQKYREREGDGEKPGSPVMDASGGETLEERSSKEGSPTKEAPSPSKDKKKKKKFTMPSFSKKKKDSKESTI